MKNTLRLFLLILIFNSPLSFGKTVVVTNRMSGKVINAKLAALQGGDTLLFSKGYYRVNLTVKNKHGVPDKAIVIRGEDCMHTTIDGGAPRSGQLKNYGVHIENSSWITIDNLSFKDCWLDVVRADESSYISLVNCHIEGGRRALYALGRKSHHFLVENCYWEQGEHVWTKEDEFSWEELHHGEFRHYNGSIFQGKWISGSFVIRDNYIKNVYNGIRLSIMGEAESDTLACTNGEIYRNVIENSSDNAFEPEVYCKNLHFYHNKMINSHAFISVTEVGGGPLYFYGNTGVKLPDCRDGWTIFKLVGKERRLTQPFYIFNNSWQVDSDVLGRINETHWHSDYIRHFNNAYYLSKGDTVGIYYLGKDNRFENDCANIPFPNQVVQTGKRPAIVGDPMFVDGKYGNFFLRENSPCKDAGMIPEDIPLYFTGDKLDIGAYDDGKLVEGPVFRYVNPGKEMPDSEKPRIVKHQVEGNKLKLWLSYPLDRNTVDARYFALNGIRFHTFSLQEDNHLLELQATSSLPQEQLCLSVSEKPKGTNGEELTYWASSVSVKPVSKADQVLVQTRKAADYLIRNTLFDFEPKVVTFNAQVSRLRIPEEVLNRADRIAYARTTIHSEEAKETLLGFSFCGDISLYVNGKFIYTGKSDKETFEEYTYNRFRFDQELNVYLNKGENTLLIKASGTGRGLDFSCCALKSNQAFDASIQIKNNIANSHIQNWLVTKPVDVLSDSVDNHLIPWQMQSPMVQQAWKISSFVKNKKGFTPDWHYANSNTLLGMLSLYNASNDYNYRAFVEQCNKHMLTHYAFFKEQYISERVLRGAYFRLYRATMLDDTSGAALPLAETALPSLSLPLHQEILDKTLEYVLQGQSRLPDGTLCRPEPVEETIWADDMFMSVPFLLRMAKLKGDNNLYDEAAFQVLRMYTYLTDTETNLCRHGWFNQTQELSPVAWSRANGWVVWAMSEALLALPTHHKEYKKIKSLFVKRLVTLLKYQSDTGLWHQIIDRSDSYLETSGSAMFGLALGRAINNRWISRQYAPQLIKTWEAVSAKIDEHGVVHGICQGTDMGTTPDYYMNQKTPESDPRGMGAVLTFGAEMYHFYLKN